MSVGSSSQLDAARNDGFFHRRDDTEKAVVLFRSTEA
jgi:hypothetical protein